ncbi:MAG: hypothetical protein BWY06_00368 [Candidatus Latescibacteria bacterium ADurb.Bin168]|nr:MAG: hypothetical protein BWY06_00368 [Candidatus Latescibacteria bacterium ADurb.Bin168]
MALQEDHEEFGVGDGAWVLSEVASASHLREGPEGVRTILRVIATLEPVPLRVLASKVRLPLPVTVAVIGELSARGMTERTPNGVRLTPGGTSFVETMCGEAGHEETVGLSAALDDLVALRPQADVTLDQAKATVGTLVRRVNYLLQNDSLWGRRILFLGDDDFVAVAVARWVDQCADGESAGPTPTLTVVDIDERVCDGIRKAAPSVQTFVHDLRNPLPDFLQHRFDVVFTDPPYTPRGAELFLCRAAEAVEHEGAHCFFSMGHLDPGGMRQVQAAVSGIGWVIVEWIPAFNEYEGSSVLANVSLMAHLIATAEIAPTLRGTYEGPLYTADVRPVIRVYRCLGCSAEWEVGKGKRWITVERLKEDRCPLCRSDRFLRARQHSWTDSENPGGTRN